MKQFNAGDAARLAVSANVERPATAIACDSPDVRLVVFRLEPGQEVRPHTSTSNVVLTVLGGTGFFTGEIDKQPFAQPCVSGDVAVFAPKELHGMRATDDELLLLATITPRPGGA